MLSVLRHYAIKEVIVNAISVIYNNPKKTVMVDGNISYPFQVTAGVLQGVFWNHSCSLYPLTMLTT